MERVPVEVWQQILLKVMDPPIFATSCTPYSFLCLVALHDWQKGQQKLYPEYQEQRRRLRLVCRAWNEFVLLTGHCWLLLDGRNPMYELDPTTTPRVKGGVGPVENLFTSIRRRDMVAPTLSWVSHILKRPANQSPLRAYALHVLETPMAGYNPLDLLVGTTTTQNPECTNTTLRLLSISGEFSSTVSISLSQISRNFTGLRSLSLRAVMAASQQTLSLAHLEVLCLEFWQPEWEELQQSIETWDTPALRHVRLGHFRAPLADVLDPFLGQYAHQIETLVLSEFGTFSSPLLDLPSGFWAQFPALRLLGLDCDTINRKGWSGWSVVPPPTHPCRYLVCRIYHSVMERELECEVKRVVDDICSRWTWRDGVRLVVGIAGLGRYYIVKNIRDSPSIANMESPIGILPEL